ncbi:hypothetical protein AN478_06050 [Thiohalorhabdus denitrificans]|nr:hypothetical protein AN478_06050 [Thiohalorhabdus denitrificans]
MGTRGLREDALRTLPLFLQRVALEKEGEWRLVSGEEAADVLLVDIDRADPPGGSGTAAAQDEIPVVAVSDDPGRLPPGRPGLVYPLRAQELGRALLRSTGAEPSESPESETPAEPAQPAPGAKGNPPAGPCSRKVAELIEPLRREQAGTDLRLDLEDGHYLAASPEKGYFVTTLHIGGFAHQCPGLAEKEWQPIRGGLPEGQGPRRSMAQLEWLLAYFGARDGLLPQIPRDAGFTLQAWPDYQVVPMAANKPRVWAYLKGHAADAGTIAAATGVDWGEVVGSLNAGWLAGAVRSAPVTTPSPAGSKDGTAKAEIIGKIQQRLGLQPGGE